MASNMISLLCYWALLILLRANEGDASGKPCIFPFIYRNRTFHTCTNENSELGRFWCATTGNYDKDKQWRYCADSSNSNGKPCVFPFIYRGHTFHKCTNEKSEDGRYWCATTGNYDKDKQWSYCADSSNSNGKPCVFPFIYRDRTYHTCTNENSEDGRYWCATTGNYDKDKQWSYCTDSKYTSGKPCVFPFIYRDRTFRTCTNENSEDGRFWCATTGNYDKDKQWTYCAKSSG